MSEEEEKYCFHCGDSCGSNPVIFDDKYFCCNGCKSVYQILNSNQLDNYYTFEKTPGIKPNFVTSDKYKFLDNEEIANRLFDFKEGNTRRVRLFLPEIHCSSCIWLLENLHKLNEAVISSEVNFVKKEASITFNNEKLPFSSLATLLDKIGYPPKFDAGNNQAENKTSKKFYYQIGVALFCFGNIMLFSFPEYTNIDESYYEFRPFFSYIIFAISLPLLLFSARDYWVSAYKALRAKTLNLDVPITIGIAALYGKSSFDIFTNNGPGYMDSFAGFILFLLIGKWFQNQTYKALSFERDYKSYFPLAVTKLVNEEEVIEPIEKVHEEDVLLIRNEEIIPADAVLLSEQANIDYSFVTGESTPVKKAKGDEIFAGGKQIGDAVRLKVLKKVEQSYLTQLWNQKAFHKEVSNSISKLTDKLSHYFIFGVIVTAIITGVVWFFIDPSNVFNIVTAVLIVACPCALALSIPFTFGNAMRASGRNRFYLKNTNAVEQLGKVTDIVFDKTGTITEAHSSKINFEGEALTTEFERLILSAVRNSSHPLSKTIYNTLKGKNLQLFEVEEYHEEKGKGIIAKVEGKQIKVGSAEWVGAQVIPNKTTTFIKIDDQVLGYYLFENQYRPEFETIIKELQKEYNVHLLTGDNDSEKENLLKYFSDEEKIKFNQKPIDKLQYIEKLQNQDKVVMMLGDGLNDAGALQQSNVGIVVSDDVYNFSPACDGILDARGLHKLPQFLDLGKYSLKVLRSSYIFSFVYNIVGLSFAVMSMLTPLVAAILMPLSSISVVIFTTVTIGVWGKRNL